MLGLPQAPIEGEVEVEDQVLNMVEEGLLPKKMRGTVIIVNVEDTLKTNAGSNIENQNGESRIQAPIQVPPNRLQQLLI